MQSSIKGYLQSILFLIVSHITISLILAIPMYYCVLSQSTYELISLLLSCILWCIAGIFLGKSIYNKALFKTLPIALIYLLTATILSLLNKDFSIYSLAIQTLRMILFFITTRIFMTRK